MRESIKIFLDSSKDEKEFFGIQRDDLVSLREYRNALLTVDNRFKFLTSGILALLQMDLKWLDSVSFDGMQNQQTGEFFMKTIYLNAYDGEQLIVVYNKQSGRYEDSCYNKIPTLYKLSSRIRTHIKRQEEILNPEIQKLIKQIESAGEEVYDGCLHRRNSASGQFTVIYKPDLGMLIEADNDDVASFFHRKPKYKEENYFDNDTKNIVLDKIMMKPEHMPNVDREIVLSTKDKTLKKELKIKKENKND